MNAWTLAWIAVVLDSMIVLFAIWLLVRLALLATRSSQRRYHIAFGSMLIWFSFAAFDYFQQLSILLEPRAASQEAAFVVEVSFVRMWPQMLWNLWLAGAIAIFGWRVLGYFHLAKVIARARPGRQQLLDNISACCDALHLKCIPTVLESEEVSTPMLIGWLSPRLLWPRAHLDTCSIDEMQVLLTHELMHLRRKDPLALLTQLTVEGLFFYHPAIWALSKITSHEREAACDEEVVAHCQKPEIYAHALIRLEEFRSLPHYPLATAARSSKNDMIDRLHRILKSRGSRGSNSTRRFSPWPAACITAVGLACFSLAHLALAQTKTPCGYSVCTGDSKVDARIADAWPAIQAAAQRYELDPKLLVALCLAESNGQQDAESSTGAIGLMQVMPSTFTKLAQERNLPAPERDQQFQVEINLDYASYLLRNNLDRYAADHGDEEARRLAIAAYNAGHRKVADVLAGKSVFSTETTRHSARVTKHYQNVVVAQ